MENLTGKLLIASPELNDPNFSHTVILVCEHTSEGAFGLVINRVLMNSYLPLLKAFEIENSKIDMPIYFGGPVRPDEGYILYYPYSRKYGAIRIGDDIGVTTSRELLNDIAQGRGPIRRLFILGFAGWTAGQIENELMEDSWLVAPLSRDILFKLPIHDRWKQAASSIGINFDRFFSKGGSA